MPATKVRTARCRIAHTMMPYRHGRRRAPIPPFDRRWKRYKQPISSADPRVTTPAAGLTQLNHTHARVVRRWRCRHTPQYGGAHAGDAGRASADAALKSKVDADRAAEPGCTPWARIRAGRSRSTGIANAGQREPDCDGGRDGDAGRRRCTDGRSGCNRSKGARRCEGDD